jgi:hypothetical protein
MPSKERFGLRATELLLARRIFYGTTEVRVGADISPLPGLVDADWERAAEVGSKAVKGAHLELDEQAISVLLSLLAEHFAAATLLEERRNRMDAGDSIHQARPSLKLAGPLTEEQEEFLRLREAGLLSAPMCFPLDDEHFASISPRTRSGQEHDDLSDLTALRIWMFLKATGLRGWQAAGRRPMWEVISVLVAGLKGEDEVGIEGVRRGAGTALIQLRGERERRARLFALSPEQILSARVCLDPKMKAIDLADDKSRQPLHTALPGMTSISGKIAPPSREPGVLNSHVHIPARFIPSIEAWHDQLGLPAPPKQRRRTQRTSDAEKT